EPFFLFFLKEENHSCVGFVSSYLLSRCRSVFGRLKKLTHCQFS
ncbi:unnamed protein product, partial [Arabidopsis halleri]